MNPNSFALITGAAGDIGIALVEAFNKAGYKVIATDIKKQAKDLACHAYIQADLAKTVEDEDYATEVFTKIQNSLDGKDLNVLINNAAIQILDPIEKLSRQDWQKTLQTNLLAPFIWSQAFIKSLEKSKGNIINMSSIHAKLTKKNFVAYASSKAALSGMTKAMAVELGKRVRVNAIEPAAIETQMLLAGFENNNEAYQQLKKYHPVDSIGTPQELARFAVFIADSEMRFLSGECFPFDGAISSRLFDPD